MKPSKYPIETIMKILSEVDQSGSSIGEVYRKYCISRTTFDKWKEKYKGLTLEEAKRHKELEEENKRLKKMISEKELEKKVLKDVIKNFDDIIK